MSEIIIDTENGIKLKLWWREDGRLQLEHWDGLTWNDKIKLLPNEINTIIKSLKYMSEVRYERDKP